MAGIGASCSPKWSGIKSAEYPRSSAWRAWSAHEWAVPSGALESCAAKRKRRWWAMPTSCPRSSPADHAGSGRRASAGPGAGLEAVEGGGVGPEDQPAGLGVERGQRLGQLGRGPRERRVGMGVVRPPHDAVRTDMGGQGGQGRLVDLEADPALAGEVLARQERHRRRVPMVGGHLVVEALEPVRRPPAAGLEEDHLEAGVTLEDPGPDQL